MPTERCQPGMVLRLPLGLPSVCPCGCGRALQLDAWNTGLKLRELLLPCREKGKKSPPCEGMVLTAPGSQGLTWDSTETGRKLSLLPPADFRIVWFSSFLSLFPAVAVGSPSSTGSTEKQQGPRDPRLDPVPGADTGAEPTAMCSAGPWAPLQTRGLAAAHSSQAEGAILPGEPSSAVAQLEKAAYSQH